MPHETRCNVFLIGPGNLWELTFGDTINSLSEWDPRCKEDGDANALAPVL